MKRCTLDTNIITAFLKNDLRVVQRVSDYLELFEMGDMQKVPDDE